MGYKILEGDCLTSLIRFPTESIDSIIQDPPYEIGFMGKGWDNTGVAYDPKTWRAAHRVLKKGGYMVTFGATRTHHRMMDAMQRAGFEVLGVVAWCYGTGFPKSQNISKAIDKRGGEDVSWFGKWLKEWRTTNGIKQKEVSKLFPSKTGGLTGCVANWELGFNLPTNEQFNLICQTFDLPFTDLNEVKGEFLGTKKHSRSGGDDFAKIVGSASTTHLEEIYGSGSRPAHQWEGWGSGLKPAWEPIIIARKKGGEEPPRQYSPFHYIAKPSKKERNAGCDNLPEKLYAPSNQAKAELKRGNTDYNAWEGKDHSKRNNYNHIGVSKNNHPTVKPVALMEALVAEFSDEGDVVLDCFAGSGTTGIAALRLNREFIGCEMTKEYIPLMQTRLDHAVATLKTEVIA